MNKLIVFIILLVTCTMSRKPSIDAFNKILPNIPAIKEYTSFDEYTHNFFRQELNIILDSHESFFFHLLDIYQSDAKDSVLFYTQYRSDSQIIDLIESFIKKNPEYKIAGKLEEDAGLFKGGFVNYLANADLKVLFNLSCSVSKKLSAFGQHNANHSAEVLSKFSREELLQFLYNRRTFVYFPNIVLKDEVSSIQSNFPC